MTLNVKGRNIEINDKIAEDYKKAVRLELEELDVLCYISEEYHTNNPEKIIQELSLDDVSRIAEKYAARDTQFHMEFCS